MNSGLTKNVAQDIHNDVVFAKKIVDSQKATLSTDAHIVSYLNDGREKDIVYLVYLLLSVPCEESTCIRLAKLIRENPKIRIELAIILKDHSIPCIREIGRYTLAEHPHVTMIQLLQIFNLSILHRKEEPSENPYDTSFFVDKIISHGAANIFQLKLVLEKFKKKLADQIEEISEVDIKTIRRLELAIEKKGR
jgi:hypothetical protein